MNKQSESGAALVLAILFTIVATGVVLTGTLILKSHVNRNRTVVVVDYQAVMTGRSGLAEALSWLRRQTSQPVLAFEPQLDPAAEPPALDTEDPDIGLVRTFPITGDVWARYEVWKQWPGDPDPERLAWRQQVACEDVSMQRTGSTPGSIWKIRSLGYVYRLVDPNVAFDTLPNVTLATELIETEVLRAVINLPGQAAINVADGNSCHINTNGRVNGGSLAGIYYLQGTGTPTTGPASQNRVIGTPALSAGTTYDDSLEAVFGLTLGELSSIADVIVTDPADFPSPLPENSVVVINMASFNIDDTNSLTGAGIVIMNGNLTLSPGNQSLFSGLLYVDGNLTLRAPCEINGSVICTGNMTIQGTVDYATVNYDEDALAALLEIFGNYRRSNAMMLPRRSR